MNTLNCIGYIRETGNAKPGFDYASGPMKRGIDISSRVADSPAAVIRTSSNGIAVEWLYCIACCGQNYTGGKTCQFN
jgi:hypothetical protein